jgi:uncharacterized protein (DUF1800 family)
MPRPTPLVEHLLRRAGFGASPEDRDRFAALTYPLAVATLTDFDPASTDVDDRIGAVGYIGIEIPARGFSPNTVINDARLRWLFRMVHSPAPLQEKMALFWHHHFATAYTKVAAEVGNQIGTRMMAAKPSEDAAAARGQIELFRERGLGSFRQLLIDVAQDVAMLYWLDNRLNTRTRPQENFGRELMELFTFGVEHYTEPDVYAAARVFTGWTTRNVGTRDTPTFYRAFTYNAGTHDTNAKDFSFPIYANGSRRIEARPAAQGMQDGIDLINALAVHPETARRLARRLWTWFVSEVEPPSPTFVENIAGVYLRNDTTIKPVIRAVLFSREFTDPGRFHQRYSWPVEFVVRMLKEAGHVGFSLNSTLSALNNMGQQLFEPPDVNGWDLGPAWFSTSAMLSRMNFASDLARNQRFELQNAARGARESPDALIAFVLERLALPAPDPSVHQALVDYVVAGGTWTGSDAQLLNKTGGLVHLLAGSSGYQFV